MDVQVLQGVLQRHFWGGIAPVIYCETFVFFELCAQAMHYMATAPMPDARADVTQAGAGSAIDFFFLVAAFSVATLPLPL